MASLSDGLPLKMLFAEKVAPGWPQVKFSASKSAETNDRINASPWESRFMVVIEFTVHLI
jgi:hypothetical protein